MRSIKLIIAGGRDKWLTKAGFQQIDNTIKAFGITEGVQGGAKGVDEAAKTWLYYRHVPTIQINAAWGDLNASGAVVKVGRYGKYNVRAGFDRNEKMAQYVQPNGVLLAFCGGSGTASMVSIAKKYKLKVVDVSYNNSFVRQLTTRDRFNLVFDCGNPLCDGLSCEELEYEFNPREN